MNNQELYRKTFDQVHASEEMIRKVKMMEHNKKNIRRNMQYSIAALVILLFLGSNAVCYAATGKNLYTFIVKGSMIQDFFNAENNPQVANQIENNSNYVENQSVIYESYIFNLYRYYSENSSGIILAEFCVTDLDGKQLSNDAMLQLTAEANAGLEDASNHFSIDVAPQMNGSMNTEVYRDKDGNAIIAFHCMVALLGPDDTQVNTKYIDDITELVLGAIDKDGKCTEVGSFKVPANPTKLACVTFDISESPKCEYAVISAIGMQLVFNINIAKEEFEKELDASGIKNKPDYDPEEHSYTLYKDISVHLKDGTEYKIIDNGSLYQEDDALVPAGLESGHPYEYSTGLQASIFGFNSLLDVSQVDYLELDGKKYIVQK